jgi:lipoprotein-releasing system permease protein
VQGRWHLIPLDPATYYVDFVPMEWGLGWWLLLNVALMAVSVGMLIGPSFLISHIHPARSIRWE